MKPTRGKDTRIATGTAELPCYEVFPPHPAGERPTGRIVLLQEIFGTNQHIRELADQWADEGFHVIVPDLFWRIEPASNSAMTARIWKPRGPSMASSTGIWRPTM